MALTQITEKGIKDGEILNADINASAAISKSKIETFVNNNADNRVITGSGTANTLNGESSVVIDSIGQVSVGGSTTAFDTTGSLNGLQGYYETDSGIATIGSYSSGGSTVLNFHTNSGGGASAERMRIDSSGRVGIRNTSMSSFNGGGDDLVIGDGTDHAGAGITLLSHSTDNCSIFFNDTVSSGVTGLLQYRHDSDAMLFSTAGSERMRIDSSGRVLIGATSSVGDIANHLQVVEPDGGKLAFARDDTTVSANADLGVIQAFGNDNNGSYQEVAAIRLQADKNHGNNDKPGRIVFLTTQDGGSSSTERMRIASNGDMGINVANPGSRLAIYDDDGDCLLLASHNYSGEARIGFNGGSTTGGTLVNNATCGAIGVTASAPSGAAVGYMSLYTNNGDDLHEAVRIAADNTVHVAATDSDDVTYSVQTGRAQHSNNQSKVYSITGLAWGQITFKIGVSDGNAKYGHFAVLLGGSMWSSGNGYNATVIANDASGVNISVNKQDGGYHITIANAGNSNTLYGAWQLEASLYSNLGKPTLTIT
jgi:hypothetical protein